MFLFQPADRKHGYQHLDTRHRKETYRTVCSDQMSPIESAVRGGQVENVDFPNKRSRKVVLNMRHLLPQCVINRNHECLFFHIPVHCTCVSNMVVIREMCLIFQRLAELEISKLDSIGISWLDQC